MRLGNNPQKDRIKEPLPFFHQVVVPVYIPNEEGYFKNSFAILHHCLESLFRTSHNKTYFTIVNNGSFTEVAYYLENLLSENKIHELINVSNIGKINSVFKGVTGHAFPLVTITDADVLFLNNWQKASYQIFEEFPKVGCVSPSPLPKLLKYHTSGPIISNLFSKKLYFKAPLNANALKNFAHSIGNPEFYDKVHLTKVLTLKGKRINAVLGSGHFAATYRGSVFGEMGKKYCTYKLGGNSDEDFLDAPVEKKGYWRLSTQNNYAHHMGNILEPWMLEILKKITQENSSNVEMPFLKEIKQNSFMEYFGKIIFKKILIRKPIWTWFLKLKGLSKKDALKY